MLIQLVDQNDSSVKGVLDTREDFSLKNLLNGGQENFFIAPVLCSDKPEVIFNLEPPPSFSDAFMVWGQIDKDGTLNLFLAPQTGDASFPFAHLEGFRDGLAAGGSKTNVSEVQTAIKDDLGKADEIRLRLAEIAAKADEAQRQAELQQRQADLEQIKLAFADTANARGQTADLAKVGSPLAWGAPIISVLVLIMFAATMVVALCSASTANNVLVNAMLGTLGTMSTAVVTYWVGSSAGSTQKTALLAKAQPIT